MSYVVVTEGIATAEELRAAKPKIVEAARRAINETALQARTLSAQEIRKQVNFQARYLVGVNGRLEIPRKASNADLQTSIVGRFRATSLARFARNKTPGKPGVTVEVKPGAARYMKRAFLMKLKRGSANIETAYNLGLAVRLKPGESLKNKREMISIAKNLYLLYGPSVDQVFRTVSEDVSPDAANMLERNFNRLLDLGELQ